jgi:hypothetical protein
MMSVCMCLQKKVENSKYALDDKYPNKNASRWVRDDATPINLLISSSVTRKNVNVDGMKILKITKMFLSTL